jgi:hypothetical protein
MEQANGNYFDAPNPLEFGTDFAKPLLRRTLGRRIACALAPGNLKEEQTEEQHKASSTLLKL